MAFTRRALFAGAGALALTGCSRPPSAPPIERPFSAPPRPSAPPLELGDPDRDFQGRIGGLALGIAVRNDEVLGWMSASTTGAKRIRAGLPREWTVGDKTGTGGTYGTANDVAIAHPPGDGGPLVPAVYTNRTDPGAEPDDSVLAKTAERMAGLLT